MERERWNQIDEIREGQQIGSYTILSPLGAGGMGEVFLAHDTTLNRKVALKFLPNFMQEDATARKRFLREAKLAAALDHPFICKVYEIGEEGGNPLLSKLSWKTDFGQVKSLKTKLRNEILLATSRIQ